MVVQNVFCLDYYEKSSDCQGSPIKLALVAILAFPLMIIIGLIYSLAFIDWTVFHLQYSISNSIYIAREPHDFAYYYQDSAILLLSLARLVLPVFLVLSVIVLITFYWKMWTSSSSFKRDIRFACGHIFRVQPHISRKLLIFGLVPMSIFWSGDFELYYSPISANLTGAGF